MSFFQSICSPSVLLLYIFMITVMQQQTWTVSTIYDQILYRSGDANIAEFHSSFFGLVFPVVGFFSNLIYGRLVQNLNFGFILLTLCSCGYTVVKYLPNVSIQLLMYLFWVPWRSCAFTFYYASFQKIKINKKYLMTLTSIEFSISGTLSFFTVLYNFIVEEYLNGSFLFFNIALDSFNILVHFVVLFSFSKMSIK
eukprot:gene9690-1896_t